MDADGNRQGDQPSIGVEKKIIKTGNITIEVSDFQKARKAIDTLITDYKGIVTEENENRSGYRLSNTLVIRLQPEQFDGFVNSIGAFALNVEQKSISERDVTKEFIDLETRLNNKKSVITRYRELLKKATSVKDILDIEEALRRVTEEVESTEGQLKYLRDQVSLSTVYLTYYEQLDPTYQQKKGFFARIADSLVAGWKGLQELVIRLIASWHIILFFGFLFWGVGKLWRRRKNKMEQEENS